MRAAKPDGTHEAAEEGGGPAGTERVLVLEPGRTTRHYWADVWEYRELMIVLAWRDISVRYKQALVGVVWALLRPLLTMVIFTLLFDRLAGMPSVGGAPYEIVVFAGMLPWFLFSAIVADASNSLVNNANLIGKVYFPRIAIPLSSAVVATVDFFIGFVLFLGLMLVLGYRPSPTIALLPLFVGWAVVAALGPALLMAALNVRYRDFRQIVPFVVQFGLYVSPVGYVSSVVPDGWRLLYSLNPIVGAIDGFRWCVLGDEAAPWLPGMAASGAVALVMLAVGFAYFRRTERSFADVI